ncbi:hypothetical protein INR49_018788 [Caranx melampygus]|nr:hypothetical protein INR49_018788 [Caranx melampygus]
MICQVPSWVISSWICRTVLAMSTERHRLGSTSMWQSCSLISDMSSSDCRCRLYEDDSVRAAADDPAWPWSPLETGSSPESENLRLVPFGNMLSLCDGGEETKTQSQHGRWQNTALSVARRINAGAPLRRPSSSQRLLETTCTGTVTGKHTACSPARKRYTP